MDKESIKHHVNSIARIVAESYGITPERMQEKTQITAVKLSRQLTWHIAREIYGTRISTSELGAMFAGRDHATVLHSIKTINNLRETDKKFSWEYEILLNRFQNISPNYKPKKRLTTKQQLEEVLRYQDLIHAKIRIREVIKNLAVIDVI